MTTLLRILLVPLAAALALLPTSACGHDGPTVPGFPDGSIREGAIRVLFVGNSLTYHNDLGGMVERLARATGDDGVRTATTAFADFALEDHLAEGTAVEALRKARWEFVVMQQGPSSLPANQLHLAQGARAFEPLVRGAGAEPVLYMVWPDASRRVAFPDVRTSYRNAAAAVHGIFAPAGDAWLAAWDLDPSLELYSDGLHPTVAGTYLAALVILHRVRGIDPTTVPVEINGLALSPSTATLLQRAAVVALQRNPARPTAVAGRQ